MRIDAYLEGLEVDVDAITDELQGNNGGGSGLTDFEAALYAIAITVGVACLSAGYAVGKVGAAALGALGLVMILSGSIDAVKQIIALGALPFVYIVVLLMVCLLKALKEESP